MNLTRWQVQRVASWVGAMLVLLLLAIMVLPSHRTATGEREFLADEAYRNLVVAQTLRQSSTYGIHADHPIPMFNDTLWRGLLAASHWLFDDLRVGVNAWGLVLTIITLSLLMRLSRLVFPFPLFVYFVGGLFILRPGTIAGALSGLATPLALCLVTAAVVFHLERLAVTGRGLPVRSAVCIGLAAWLRLEWIVVWLALWLHVFIVAWIPAPQQPRAGASFFRGLNGLLLIALLLLPLFAYNASHLQSIWAGQWIPWLRLPGIPMAADAWATLGAATALAETVTHIQAGWRLGFAAMGNLLFGQGLFVALFFTIGYVLLLIQGIRSREDRGHLFFVLWPWSVPFFFGLLYPYVGVDGLEVLIQSVAPVLTLVVAFGAVRMPFVFASSFSKRWPAYTSDQMFRYWWTGAGAILVLALMVGQWQQTRGYRAALNTRMDERQTLTQAIEENGLMRDRFVTDEPGWLVWRHRARVMDLQGEWTPQLIEALDATGAFEPDALERVAFRMQPPPTAVVLWRLGPEWGGILQEPEWLTHLDTDPLPRPLIAIGEPPSEL